MSSPIICQGLSKHFRSLKAIDDLNLEVPEGSIYALIGANGAGKTTLIKMMVNILRPSGGQCLVLGKDARRMSGADFQRIGYVSENQEMPEWKTVEYFLEYLKPFYTTWDIDLAKQLVREFDLPLDRPLSKLSRGMKMKAALASSLAYRPKLILLDEPFSGLDAMVRDEVTRGLLEWAGETTILVSSHDLAEMESFASHIGFMDQGRVQFSEESAALAGRFRQVEVRLEGTASLPSTWPPTWLKLERSTSLVRFVESRYSNDAQVTIAQMFPGALEISVTPMSLRDIFVTLAQTQRKRAA